MLRSVADEDPDPAFNLYADPNSRKSCEYLQRRPLQTHHGIRVSLQGCIVSLLGSSVEPPHLFDADLVPAFYFDTNSGPDPAFLLR